LKPGLAGLFILEVDDDSNLCASGVGPKRQEVLSSLDGLAHPSEELLQVLRAFDEIDLGSINDQ
jgi:hypothetical protein